MNLITLVLPLPDKDLSPNKRLHWGVKSRLIKDRRSAVKYDTIYQVRQAKMPDNLNWKNVTVTIRWDAQPMRFPDADNALATLKSTMDGIVDSHLLDDDRQLRYEPIYFFKDKNKPRVEITLALGD